MDGMIETKRKRQTSFSIFWRRFRRQKTTMLFLAVLVVIVMGCFLAPVIAPYRYDEIDSKSICQTPSMQHIFGTDDMGRDIFSRILYGGRSSLIIGVVATTMAVAAGLFMGSIAGYFGGVVDTIIMRVCDVMAAIPATLFSIVIAAVLGTGFWKLMVALAIGTIVSYARMIRASILSIRNSQYIEAATATNCSTVRIIVKHIIPNTLTPIIVSATMGVSQIILAAATLSYIGLGIQPPNPEWGAMLSGARDYLRSYPHMLIFPGVMIAVTVLCFNMIGDGMRDATDPRLND